MVFSSSIFLFGFLPAFLTIYYLTPNRFRNLTILVGSYVFYGWWRVDFLALFAFVTVWNYSLSYVIGSDRDDRVRKAALTIGVIGDLAVLAYFKYFNFGVDSFKALFEIEAQGQFSLWTVILPIGISFYIFQAISYLVDVYRRDAPVAPKLIDFAAFIALFPQLIAGPVLRYKDLVDQFAERVHSWALFTEGARRFAIGLAMKVLIADSVAPLADMVFATESPTAAEAWLGAAAYTIQLFFDFAGYSAMAIGLGLMMGFRFIENFNNPYASQSITEFWRRWHISLSAWLRDYLYIPLGGSKVGRARTYVNLFLTMLLGGLWHGANWTFVIWGAWHGMILAIERALGVKADLTASRVPWRVSLTLVFVIIGWVMFRADTVGDAIGVYQGMLGVNGWSISTELAWRITDAHLVYLSLGAALTVWMYLTSPSRSRIPLKTTGGRFVVADVALALLIILSGMKVVSQAYSPFLYFQF